MKDLLSKKHYYYKTYTLRKSGAYPTSKDNPFWVDYLPHILQTNLDTPLLRFFKNLNLPINEGGGVHTMAKVTFNQTYVGKTDRQIKECIIDPKRGEISDLRKHAFKSQRTVA